MKYAVIAYTLPDGTIAGYNGDVLCNIHLGMGSAKHYPFRSSVENEKQLAIVQRNFTNLWKEHQQLSERRKGSDDNLECYTKWDGWKGYSVQDIKATMIPVMVITETVKLLFELDKSKKKHPGAFTYRMRYLQNLLEDPDGDDLAEAKKVIAKEERIRLEQKAKLLEKFKAALDEI